MNREIPIIADALLVDPELGTGCVKVTPAHDPNDYACGQRHKLPMINILNPDGTHQRERRQVRRDSTATRPASEVTEAMEALGLLRRCEDRDIR